ncbi:hypothetical protein H4Q26_000254 [Puccinia striiformis f. sp. tritici PST-130]|nr:hypothetical protein H4Q26_000254 [Puccinia striiformis f. sp. tritici PST-130]
MSQVSCKISGDVKFPIWNPTQGGDNFKRDVVKATFDVIQFIGKSKETVLPQLCEFIEDCEFSKLSVSILHL